MARSIRLSTFETNSSSSHVVTVSKTLDIDPNKTYTVHLGLGEFGWIAETGRLTDYLWTSICQELYWNYDKDGLLRAGTIASNIRTALSKYAKVELSYDDPNDPINEDWWYVDHAGRSSIACDVIDFDTMHVKDEDLLARMILSDESRYYTGNDNGGPSPEWDDYPYDIDEDLIY